MYLFACFFFFASLSRFFTIMYYFSRYDTTLSILARYSLVRFHPHVNQQHKNPKSLLHTSSNIISHTILDTEPEESNLPFKKA